MDRLTAKPQAGIAPALGDAGSNSEDGAQPRRPDESMPAAAAAKGPLSAADAAAPRALTPEQQAWVKRAEQDPARLDIALFNDKVPLQEQSIPMWKKMLTHDWRLLAHMPAKFFSEEMDLHALQQNIHAASIIAKAGRDTPSIRAQVREELIHLASSRPEVVKDMLDRGELPDFAQSEHMWRRMAAFDYTLLEKVPASFKTEYVEAPARRAMAAAEQARLSRHIADAHLGDWYPPTGLTSDTKALDAARTRIELLPQDVRDFVKPRVELIEQAEQVLRTKPDSDADRLAWARVRENKRFEAQIPKGNDRDALLAAASRQADGAVCSIFGFEPVRDWDRKDKPENVRLLYYLVKGRLAYGYPPYGFSSYPPGRAPNEKLIRCPLCEREARLLDLMKKAEEVLGSQPCSERERTAFGELEEMFDAALEKDRSRPRGERFVSDERRGQFMSVKAQMTVGGFLDERTRVILVAVLDSIMINAGPLFFSHWD
jgi:hypothetical protein